MGNVKNSNIESIWNSDRYKALRASMLQGKKISMCNNCYKHEQHNPNVDSPRLAANKQYAKSSDLVKQTKQDGELPVMSLKYLDIRWSNICNYKCRTCGEWNSSSWAAENKQWATVPTQEHTVLHRASHDNYELLERYVPYLSQLEEVYFAGGEPLLMEEHYLFLQKLVAIGNTKIRLKYNTNLSTLEYKSANVLDLWSNFDNIKLSISLDSYGARAEYIRHGTDWSKIVNNISEIKARTPHVRLSMNTVISIFNIATLPELVESVKSHGWLDTVWIKDSTLYPINNPRIYRPDILPLDMRETIGIKLRHYIDGLGPEMKPIVDNMRSALKFVDETYQSDIQKEFKRNINKIDGRRNESFSKTFPELSAWFDSIAIN